MNDLNQHMNKNLRMAYDREGDVLGNFEVPPKAA